MKTTHRISAILILALLIPFCGTASAQTVVIDVDPTVRLTCLSPFEFDITAAELSDAYAGGAGTNSSQSISTGGVSATPSGSNLIATLPALASQLTGDPARHRLQAVGCLIEATPSFRRVNVSISLTPNTVLQGNGGSRIEVRSVRGRLNGSSNAFSTSFSYSAIYHFFFDPQIEFELLVDLTDASHAGLHSSVIDGTFTVEVTSP